MSEPKLKLIEERVVRAVAQVRSLTEERNRAEDELREVRRRLEDLEKERDLLRAGLSPDHVRQIRGGIEEAVRDLRDESGSREPREGGAVASGV